MNATSDSRARIASVRVGGRERRLPALEVGGHEIVVTGSLVRTAALRDEWYAELADPPLLVAELQQAHAGVDLFTFVRRPPEAFDGLPYPSERENCAAIRLNGFDHWWKRQIGSKTRALVRKAERCGVSIRRVELDERLVAQIKEIYDEAPVRQGKPFWHYRKSLEQLREIHATFPRRSDFVGAFLGEELAGFVKLVYAGETANTMHVIAKLAHRDKAVTNALVAHAVEVACERGARLLVYDRFDYGSGGSDSLLQFKRNNGFERVEYPRYYVPFTARGSLALSLGLHRPLRERVPRPVARALVAMRNRWYATGTRLRPRREGLVTAREEDRP